MTSSVIARYCYLVLRVFRGIGLVAACVSLLACDSIRSWTTQAIEGDVFIRLGTGETRAQGGIEVRLLSPDVVDTQDSLNERFASRMGERRQLEREIETMRSRRADAVSKAIEAVTSEITIEVLSAKPEFELWSLQLELRVTNSTQFKLSSVSYRLWCVKEAIGNGSTPVNLPMHSMKRYLEPGVSCRTYAELPEYYFIDDPVEDSEIETAKRLFNCPLKDLSAQATSFGVFDADTNETDYEQEHFITLPADVPSQDRISAKGIELARMGVSDLDASMLGAIEKSTVAKTHTDINGHYKFDGLKQGSYVVFAFYKTTLDADAWFLQVDVPKSGSIDLTNYNLNDPRFAAQWQTFAVEE